MPSIKELRGAASSLSIRAGMAPEDRHSRSALPFRLVVPLSPRGGGRRRSRHPAKGLTLTCTHVSPSRLQGAGLRNLAVELRDVGWGGVRFVASELVPVPCLVNLQIRREASGETLLARGEITWLATRAVKGRDCHLVGARFDEILTPPAQAAWYFEGVVAPRPKPWEQPSAKRSHRPRAASRFSTPGCDVVLVRDHRFREAAKPGNLATRLLDLSRSGAQVACADPVGPGERMRLTVDFRNFNDIFTAEAETVWVRYPSGADSRHWRVGLAFGELSHAQQRQLLTLENWFQGPSKPNR